MKNISKILAVLTVIVSFFLIPLFVFAAPEEATVTTRQENSTIKQKDTNESVNADSEKSVNKKSDDKERESKIKSASEGAATLPPPAPIVKPADMFTEKGMGENILMATLGITVFTLLVSIITFISVKTINGYIKNSMKIKVDNLSLRVQELERKLNDEIEKNAIAARSYEKQIECVRAENATKTTISLSKTATSEKISVSTAPEAKQNNSSNFLNDYRNLMKLRGISQRNARDEFFKKYAVKAFACANFDARLQNLSTSPVYEETTESAKFWGFLDNGELLTLPALPFNYDNIVHGPGAMGEVFNSNFEAGSFEKFEVITPAVFTERLSLVKKGEIRLIG